MKDRPSCVQVLSYFICAINPGRHSDIGIYSCTVAGAASLFVGVIRLVLVRGGGSRQAQRYTLLSSSG